VEPKSELLKRRFEKTEELKARGLDPYPYKFSRTHQSVEIVQDADSLMTSGQEVRIAGRMVSQRGHGRSSFAHILDGAGKIQIYLRQEDVGEDSFTLFQLLDIGDIIGVWGTVFETKTGEVTVRLQGYSLLAKALRSLPEKWHGLRDKEIRYRQRYLDLIANQQVRELFQMRSQITTAVRRFLDQRGFLEVETPILQPVYGGAFAEPFVTRHKALGMKLFLRIADELYLKRLIIGGFERVYELSKNFRNEGIDRDHNPEFTLLELYQAYADYGDIMELVEEMITQVTREVVGSLQIQHGDHLIDLAPPWKRVSFFDALAQRLGQDVSQWEEGQLKELLVQNQIEVREGAGRGRLCEALFDALVEPDLIGPTFVIDYPLESSPLAKRHRKQPHLAERFEFFAAGKELANAFSELNDPIDQRRRFQEQARLRRAGDHQAQVVDEDFLRALEYGMPPTGGLGVGIDRVVMLLANAASIRDVILFPQMRREKP
jgi:lysyl-tRNA synthetase class 2